MTAAGHEIGLYALAVLVLTDVSVAKMTCCPALRRTVRPQPRHTPLRFRRFSLRWTFPKTIRSRWKASNWGGCSSGKRTVRRRLHELWLLPPPIAGSRTPIPTAPASPVPRASAMPWPSSTSAGRPPFWDGRAVTLEEQILEPVSHPDEMALPWSEAVERLQIRGLHSTVRRGLWR